MGAYLESRAGVYPETLFFGLQMLLLETLDCPVVAGDIAEAEALWLAHGLPFNSPGWERLVRVQVGNVLMTVESTDPAKASKAGVLDLIREGGAYHTVRLSRPGSHPASCLETVLENGRIQRRRTFDQVRARALSG